MFAFLAALGPGLYITALNVKYRDFRYVIPFIVQFGFFVSPVAFSSHVVPARWRLLYSLNPMVGVIDGFRWAICRGGDAPLYVPGFLASLVVTGLFLWLGVHAVVPPMKMNMTWLSALAAMLVIALLYAGWALWRNTRFS